MFSTRQSNLVTATKLKTVVFDPKDPAWRGKLWVRLNTSGGPKLFIIWRRVAILAAFLVVLGWLALSAAAWGFVKYKRGIENARFIDIAFYPFRHQQYRVTLGEHYYKTAQKQLEAGDWSKGLMSLRLSVSNNPASLGARQQLAEIYRQLQRPELAITILDEGLQYGTGDSVYLRGLFQLLASSGQDQRCVDLGTRLLADLAPQSASFYEVTQQVARAYIRLGKYDEATALITSSKIDQAITGQILLAEVEAAAGTPELAIIRLERILQSNSNNELTQLHLVALYRKTGRLDDARRIATIRTLSRPDSPGAAVDLIALLAESGDKAAYQRESTSFIQKYAEDERALLLLSTSAIQLKDPSLVQAIIDAAPARPDGRKNSLLLLNLIQAQYRAGQYTASLASADILSNYPNLSPRDQTGLNAARTLACYRLTRITEGEGWLNQFLNDKSQYFNRSAPLVAEELEQMGYKTETRRVLQALVDSDPKDLTNLTRLVDYDLNLQSWDAVRARLPDLLAATPPPIDLLKRIWQLQDVLDLSPDVRQRLAQLVN